jgi:hypothetical protein
MKKLVFSLLAAVALTGAFLAEAIAAFPPNDWHRFGFAGAAQLRN